MGKVDSVGGSNSVTPAFFGESNQTSQSGKSDFLGDLFSFQSYEGKTLFDQSGVTKKTLAAQVSPLGATSEARLAKVNPELASRIRAVAAELKAKGINVMVTDGMRTFAEQTALYAQGRESLSRVNELRRQAGYPPISAAANRGTVTNARAGSSFHNYGLAVDMVPLDSNSQPNWNASNATWNTIGEVGKKYGLTWGGNFSTIVDKPHLQLDGGKSSPTSYRALYDKGGLQAVWDAVNKNSPPIGNLPTAPTTPTTPSTPSTNLQAGSRGAKVRELQKDLARLGYPLAADGTFGPKTDAAVKKFQSDHNLKPDGVGGPKTRAAIQNALQAAQTPVPTTRLQKNARGEQVKELQNALVKLGFMSEAQMNTGPGIFGPRTDAAVRAFQRAKGLAADGIYGPKTQAALRKALGGPATTAPTSPTNPQPTTASAARINQILKGTNLAGQGTLIANLAKKYNVPPELALAMFRKEASFAQTGTLAQRNNNPGNIRFAGQAGATRGAGGFARWDSMGKGVEAYFKLLDNGYRKFVDNKDWAGLINKYAPPSENDSALYTREIIGWMNDYRQKISG